MQNRSASNLNFSWSSLLIISVRIEIPPFESPFGDQFPQYDPKLEHPELPPIFPRLSGYLCELIGVVAFIPRVENLTVPHGAPPGSKQSVFLKGIEPVLAIHDEMVENSNIKKLSHLFELFGDSHVLSGGIRSS